ncbi:MAG TPA: cysteine desulfurase [Glutamicibacter sp.]|uniref:Cysteine desulfurase n=1 Tax=Glutamicibacter arilaitensis (strain DSM 16368 / CIP 108037 / IAM 15318 / JCM 13566 / NCIMB 14258 / Re117) TaxID=861360 RepID=A0ABM9PW66_GLUAR|nr:MULTISPECIES: cysteine desulfurase family protein [Glutamicibacter]CBT75554.1 putative cysteine desulfurase [Glutamicibacter arilaitensis Re117]HCH48556.1 cysteine desulfurase [Glutamicibacter sp.]
MIYMDAAATAPPRQNVLDVINPLLTRDFGNPASLHESGQQAKRANDWARTQVAGQLGVAAQEVYFTSGGTEGANAAVIGAALANPRGRVVVCSSVEHPAVMEACKYLVEFHGFEHRIIPVTGTGLVDLKAAGELIDTDVAVVSVMAVNNEVGTIQPVAAVAELVHEAGALMHTDAVQGAGWIDLKPLCAAVDALSISGHKIGGLKGSGAMYLSAKHRFVPLLQGGGQQGGMRSGTENPAAAVGIAVALQAATSQREGGLGANFGPYLIERILKELNAKHPGSVQLTGDPVHRVGGIVSFVFPQTAGETVLIELARKGILCSSGSACAAGSTEPSAVLTAMGYDEQLAHTALRLSFTRTTKENEISQVASAVVSCVSGLLG